MEADLALSPGQTVRTESASLDQPSRSVNRIPTATYRLQLRSDFGFEATEALVDYLQQLGISDLYLSPLFRARKDSSHGYDVVDHSNMEREFGDSEDFARLADRVGNSGMGILLDVVPNHMGVNDPGNAWWNDVLENGPGSRFATYFDIDWDRLAENLRGKILLPVLGDFFGPSLESGHLKLAYEAGRFQILYHESRYPVTPASWPQILQLALEQWPLPNDPIAVGERVELESIVTQLRHLPPGSDVSGAATQERYREQAVAGERLGQLIERSSPARLAVDQAVQIINGTGDRSDRWDRLEQLLHGQWYRLAYWRTAADEINYRRFFDINDLAALRVEQSDVFEAVHRLVEQLLREGKITGLRIDHPDGLLDPPRYFEDLQKLYRRCRSANTDLPSAERVYVVVEKILTGEEPLAADWPVCGTTGYELMNDLNLLLVDPPGLEQLKNQYASLTGQEQSPADVIYHSKKHILDYAMSSELHVLAGRLHRLSQRHRHSCDHTFPALLRGLRELIACFPVYRTYVHSRGWDVDERDHRTVMTAVRTAKRRNPGMHWSVLDFLAKVLLLQYPVRADDNERELFRDFVLRFQQVTGPVTAKGVEDTSFYRYYPLVSLNEVGGEIDSQGHTLEEFHRRMQHRSSDWPTALSATATHDTKRGEDVRARLHVLSQIPERWIQAVRRWQQFNRSLETDVGGRSVPGANEQYLLYQTLVGTWPLSFHDDEARRIYSERITEYLRKALREAKQNTSWSNPSEEFEAAAVEFARAVLDPARSASFLEDLNDFVQSIATSGFANSLVQVVLKSTLPGVPDFYQGTELWDFHLVDPDNRRPVDYERRRVQLADLQSSFAHNSQALIQELKSDISDSRAKLFLTWRLLQTRQRASPWINSAAYLPLEVSGNRRGHALAFARRDATRWVLVVAALRTGHLLSGDHYPLQDAARTHLGTFELDWEDTALTIPDDAPGQWQDVWTGRTMNAAGRISLAGILNGWPAVVLISP